MYSDSHSFPSFYPKVSIVIPVYNGADYLQEAIDSALEQTYKNIEVLVINDGSNDAGKTQEIALSYGERIRYFSKPNGGVASALNQVIAEVSGDYVSWLSHDDLYTKDKIEKQIEFLSKVGTKNSVIYSNYSVFTADPRDCIPIRLKGVPPENFRYWITVENALHGNTLLIPRSAFEKCGNFNENLRTTQDYDLWFRLAKEYAFIHMPDILVKARSHAGQGSHKMAHLAQTECDDLLTGFVENLTPDEISTGSHKKLSDAYWDIALSMRNRTFKKAEQRAEKLAKENQKFKWKSGISFMKKSRNIARACNAISLRNSIPPHMRQVIKRVLLGLNIYKKEEFLSDTDLKEKFSEVYDKNIFGGRISRSGEGSDLVQTAIIRREIPRIVQEFGIKTFLDAPCGDWFWMQEVDLGVEQYIGVDIVDAMIAKHNTEFGNASRCFKNLNLVEDSLPKVDLIFSRDCLVHLSFEHALKIIQNFKKSGSTYLLTTTFTDRTENEDLGNGFWRVLNKQLSPFNFPKPIALINEGCSEEGGGYKDKSLGLWRLADIHC